MDTNDFMRKRRPPVLLERVQLTYPTATEPALRDIELHVAAGEFVSVIGASGAGKSTLLKILTGELRPSGGRAVVAGLDLGDLSPRSLPRLRRRIGVTFQESRLLPGRTALANLSYALELTGVPPRRARARALQALGQVGIGHLADRLPHQMSGGEAQRVQIARAVANGPQVLVCDEPTGNLDPQTTVDILDTLAALAATGTAVVMATHDVAGTDHLARRVVRLEGGRIVADVREAHYGDLTSDGPDGGAAC